MENAGRAVADEVTNRFPSGTKILVLGGCGRNGGDGMVAARHLANRGFDVGYALIGSEANIRDKAVTRNWQILQSMPDSVKIEIVDDSSRLKAMDCEVLIDAILGTGATGNLRPLILQVVNGVNATRCFKIAIDIPTGVNADDGAVMDAAVRADLTITLHAAKHGMTRAREYCGEVKVVDIGIPREAELYAGPGDVSIAVRPRPPDSHKGDFGKLLVIGGSETFTGAPALVALSAIRAGVDLAYVAAPEKAGVAIASMSPNLIVIKLRGKHLGLRNLVELKGHIRNATALVVGPGLGMDAQTFSAVKKILTVATDEGKTMVLDADALKALGRAREAFRSSVVLTPHAGEFRALTGSPISQGLSARVESVKMLASSLSCTVLSKGCTDVISDGTRTKLNRTGNAGMTVGGTGDVLAGIVGGLAAQGVDPFRAAVAGAFVNGAAGDLAAQEYGYHLAPTDLLPLIPRIMNDPMLHRNLLKR